MRNVLNTILAKYYKHPTCKLIEIILSVSKCAHRQHKCSYAVALFQHLSHLYLSVLNSTAYINMMWRIMNWWIHRNLKRYMCVTLCAVRRYICTVNPMKHLTCFILQNNNNNNLLFDITIARTKPCRLQQF